MKTTETLYNSKEILENFPNNREGNKIVCFSDYVGSFNNRIMDSDGSNKRLLYESPGFDYDPRFIKESKKVIFVSDFILYKQTCIF
ncbi:hypothetical protein ES703_77448 [subsurface metagenome]